jgi:hypothetical protein
VGVASMCVARRRAGGEHRATVTSCVGAVRHRHNVPAIASNWTRHHLGSAKHKASSNVTIFALARGRLSVLVTGRLSVVFVAV